jgi:hypothetical protein
MDTQAQHTFSGSRKIVRWVTLINFCILAVVVTAPARRLADKMFLALSAIHLEEPVGLSLQLWLPVSTLVATAVLASMAWRRRKMPADLASASIRFEAALLTAWWLALLVGCAYAFMLGMGG